MGRPETTSGELSGPPTPADDVAWRAAARPRAPGPPLSPGSRRHVGGAPQTAASASVRIEVRVELKPGVVDAEAESVAKSLALLGLRSLTAVSTARVFVLTFAGLTVAQAENAAREAVDRLLANPVIHRVALRALPD